MTADDINGHIREINARLKALEHTLKDTCNSVSLLQLEGERREEQVQLLMRAVLGDEATQVASLREMVNTLSKDLYGFQNAIRWWSMVLGGGVIVSIIITLLHAFNLI